jgi:TPR repeat protein
MMRLVIALCFVFAAGAASAERRVALVIGNGAYQHAAKLKNPRNDATAVTEALRRLDFEVVTETDVDKIGLEKAVKRFARLANDADIGLFYYSGHAVQFQDSNFLLPVSADITRPADVPLETMALQDVLNVMEAAGVKTRLVVLDACRNNPFTDRLAGQTRALGATTGGLARVSTSLGSLVVFSTAPGAVALDGTGELSPFTASFVKRALEPRVEIRQAVTRVRTDVAAATANGQIPWDNSSLMSDFYLVPKRPPPVFEKLSMVGVPRAEAGRDAPLSLPAPYQTEGGEVFVTIESAPRLGKLSLAGRTIAVGERIPARDFARLTYRPDGTAGGADAFSFAVEDSWGSRETGFVSLSTSGDAPAVAAAPVPQTSPPLGRVAAQGVSLLGLGPNLKLIQSPALQAAFAKPIRVRLAAASGGEITVGQRKLDVGKSLSIDELARLAFTPTPETADKANAVVFAAEAPSDGEVALQIAVQMHECDRLAGARLDAQGVSEGVIQGNLDVEGARVACLDAVKAYPRVGRFHYQLARVHLSQARNEAALASLQRAVDLGHARAHADLGAMHLRGFAVPRDAAKAREEFEKGARLNDVFAIHALGKLYYEGLGVPRDLERARAIFESSARVGHTYSMNNLGRMYLRGEGVEKNPDLARRYWEEAAARDDIYGLHNLGWAHLEGTGGQKSIEKAVTFFKMASDRGHPEAPNSIGRIFFLGLEGVSVNLEEAGRWYRVGAERGDGWSAYNLGEMHRLGRGTPVDLAEAATLYAQAASFFNPEPARAAEKSLAALPEPPKLEALRRLAARLDPRPLPDRTKPAILARAAEILRTPGKSASRSVDDTLKAMARAEWDKRGVRGDLF